MSDAKKGCGGKATKMACRGPVKRLFLCDDCPYEGSGRVLPYQTEVEGHEKPTGVYSGPERRCGEELGA